MSYFEDFKDDSYEDEEFDGEDIENKPFHINKNVPDVNSKELEDALDILSNLDFSNDDQMNENFEEYMIATQHVLFDFVKKNKFITTGKEVAFAVHNLSVDKALESLTNKGIIEPLIDEKGEVYYRLSEPLNLG